MPPRSPRGAPLGFQTDAVPRPDRMALELALRSALALDQGTAATTATGLHLLEQKDRSWYEREAGGSTGDRPRLIPA